MHNKQHYQVCPVCGARVEMTECTCCWGKGEMDGYDCPYCGGSGMDFVCEACALQETLDMIRAGLLEASAEGEGEVKG